MTILLAKFLGIFLTVFGLGFLLHKDVYSKGLDELTKATHLHFIVSLVPLLLGSYIVAVHTMTGSTLESVITMVGYIILFTGVLRVVTPNLWVYIVKLIRDTVPTLLIGMVIFVVGLFCFYHGFMI